MRRAATWCLKPKGRAELILSPLSQVGMLGTQRHPTARAAATSAVRNMQLGVGALWVPAVLSATASRQSRAARQTSCRTCRSTASSGRPTSIACKAEVSSETQDETALSLATPKNWKVCCGVIRWTFRSALPLPSSVIATYHRCTHLWMESSI